MFKVNNKNTRTIWKCWLDLTYGDLNYVYIMFTPFSSVSIVDFKQVNVSWVRTKEMFAVNF